MMTEGLTAQIHTSTFPCPPIFDSDRRRRGHIPERDMYNTFNMGIGLIMAIPKEQVGHALEFIIQAGEQAYVIGSVVKGEAGVDLV